MLLLLNELIHLVRGWRMCGFPDIVPIVSHKAPNARTTAVCKISMSNASAKYGRQKPSCLIESNDDEFINRNKTNNNNNSRKNSK